MDFSRRTIDEWSDFQRLLFDVSDGKTEETAEELLDSNFIEKEKDVLFLLDNLSVIMRSTPGKLEYFALFIKHIITRFSEKLNFPKHFLEKFHQYDKFTFLLYRKLFLLGFVQIEDIVSEFHDPKYPKNVRRTLLITFLPELYKYDQETVSIAFNELSKEKDLYSTHLTSENFEKSIDKIHFLLDNGQEEGSLALAIKTDDIERLKQLSSRSNTFDFKQKFKSSEFELVPVSDVPIITASAMFGSINCFKFLYLNNALSDSDDNLSQKSNSNQSKKGSSSSNGKKSMPISHAAVYGGNHEILHILQQNKIKFDGSLAAAAKNFRPDVFEWLIATFPIGMIIKPVTANGILTELLRNGDFSSLITFFNSELKSRLVDKVTPLFHAIKASNAICFAYLFNQLKADPNACNSSGYSLLHLVSDVDTANFLYTLPELDVAAVTKDGFTPLHEYASKGYVELGKMFLEHANVSVSVKSANGMTPLHCAASFGRADFIEFLLSCDGIDINAVDRDGNTPLHYAARASSKRTVEQLLEAEGVQTDTENAFGETPYFLAAKLSNAEVFSTLAELDGVDINQKDSNGYTALLYSIERPCLSIFEYLLSVDTININLPDTETGRTPLMHIIQAPTCDETNEMFETMLIVHGLNINAQDKNGNTAVHIAADMEKKDMVAKLLTVKGINLMLSNGKVTVKEAGELKSKLGRRQKKYSTDCVTESSDGGETEKGTQNMDTDENNKIESPKSKIVPEDEQIPAEKHHSSKKHKSPSRGTKNMKLPDKSENQQKSDNDLQSSVTQKNAADNSEKNVPPSQSLTQKHESQQEQNPVVSQEAPEIQPSAKPDKHGCCRI